MKPWLLQQLLKGREYSCNAIAYRGHVVAFADTDAQLSNLNYAHIGVPQACNPGPFGLKCSSGYLCLRDAMSVVCVGAQCE